MNRQSRGYTLVEMLVVIGLAGATLGLVAVSLQAVFRVGSRQRDAQAQAAMLLRVDLQFRADVHQAVSVTPAPANSAGPLDRLTLHHQDESQTQYSIEQVHVHRAVYRQGRQVHRDRFALGGNERAYFQLDTGPNGIQLACLVIEQHDTTVPRTDKLVGASQIRAVLPKKQ